MCPHLPTVLCSISLFDRIWQGNKVTKPQLKVVVAIFATILSKPRNKSCNRGRVNSLDTGNLAMNDAQRETIGLK
jgi:hypothetical protein